MNEREVKIIKNSLIFTVGNLGSKVLSYVMVLVYTYFISSSEMGYYDIVLTSIALLQPFVMLAFDEGVYRWLIGSNESEINNIIVTCVKTILCTTMIAIFVFVAIGLFINVSYGIEIILLFSTGIVNTLLLNVVRGLGNNRLYAESGILNSIVMLVLEVIGLVVLGMGIESLFISKAIANMITCIYIYYKQKEIRICIVGKFDTTILKEMLAYTLPLIPNTISWWVMNSSDRYLILIFLGSAYNGIYAIANKFPTIITMIASIIYLALQEAIIKAYDAEDRDEFYSSVFKKYYEILFFIVLFSIPLTKLVIVYFVNKSYVDAYRYVAVLFLSAVFSSLCSFLGIGYQVSKDTKRSASSTIISAVINIFFNAILIKYIGLHAAAFSTLMAYMCLFVIRIKHCKKYFELNINWTSFLGLTILCAIISLITYVGNVYVLLACSIIGLVLGIYCNRKIIIVILHKLGCKRKNV